MGSAAPVQRRRSRTARSSRLADLRTDLDRLGQHHPLGALQGWLTVCRAAAHLSPYQLTTVASAVVADVVLIEIEVLRTTIRVRGRAGAEHPGGANKRQVSRPIVKRSSKAAQPAGKQASKPESSAVGASQAARCRSSPPIATSRGQATASWAAAA